MVCTAFFMVPFFTQVALNPIFCNSLNIIFSTNNAASLLRCCRKCHRRHRGCGAKKRSGNAVPTRPHTTKPNSDTKYRSDALTCKKAPFFLAIHSGKPQPTPQRPENFMTTYSSETKTAELRQMQTTRRSVQYAKAIVDVTNSNYTTMLRCNTPDNLPVLHSCCSRHHT